MASREQATESGEPDGLNPGQAGSAPLGRVVAVGLGLSLAVGLLLGWARYWTGYFVLFQGLAGGLAIALGAPALAGAKRGGIPFPGAGTGLEIALAWFAVFQAGQALGYGLAQPWFAPVGWFLKVLNGQAVEFVFGVKASAGVLGDFAMGAHGFLWVVFTLVDWAVMLFFLYRLPWGAAVAGQSVDPKNTPEEGTDAAPPAWAKAANWIVGGVIALWLVSMVFDFHPAGEIKAARVAYRAGDLDTALRLARRAAFASGDRAIAAEALALRARAAWTEGRADEGRRLAAGVLADYPASPWGYLLRAEQKGETGDWPGVLADINAALEREHGLSARDLAPFRLLRAKAFLELNQPAEAEAEAQAAAKADRSNPEVYLLLSYIHEKQGRLQDARWDAGKAIRLAEQQAHTIFTPGKGNKYTDRILELAGLLKKKAK